MTLYYLLIFFALVVAGVFLAFQKRNKRLNKAHKLIVDSLSIDLSLHLSQIEFRQKSLSAYDFLRYNLEEVLVVQQRVKIK